jgi:hypothetical protein
MTWSSKVRTPARGRIPRGGLSYLVRSHGSGGQARLVVVAFRLSDGSSWASPPDYFTGCRPSILLIVFVPCASSPHQICSNPHWASRHCFAAFTPLHRSPSLRMLTLTPPQWIAPYCRSHATTSLHATVSRHLRSNSTLPLTWSRLNAVEEARSLSVEEQSLRELLLDQILFL